MKTPEPGVYPDVPFGDYCQWDAVNNSSLGPLLKSPAHYRAARTTPRKDTEAFRLGRLVHQTLLEPENLLTHHVVEPDLTAGIVRADGSEYSNVRATKEFKARYKEWAESVAPKEIVTQDWVDRSMAMLASLKQNERARNWLTESIRRETSIVWDEPTTGIRCKSRLDMWCDGLIPDLKTTADVCDFSRSIGKFGYFRQAAFYADAAEAATGKRHDFAFIAVETEAPFSVRAAVLDDDSLCAGRAQYRQLLRTLKECRERDDWPGPSNPDYWRAPSWATEGDEIELTVNGETVTI